MKTNIKEMSIEELKALCYDQLVNVQQSQNNIKLINEEIASRVALPESYGQNIIAEIPTVPTDIN